MTSTPIKAASFTPASRTAFRRFIGPSALTAVAGLMAPVRTTGILCSVVSSRKYAVSSMVSVPWITIIPSVLPFLSSSRIRHDRVHQIFSVISLLSIDEIVSPVRSAASRIPGTLATRSSTERAPALYPVVAVSDIALPAIVPPVASRWICGLFAMIIGPS